MATHSIGPLTGIFTKPPEIMAELLSSREHFSGGPAGGLRLLTVYIAYAGKRLSTAQKQSLGRTKEILIHRLRKADAHEAV